MPRNVEIKAAVKDLERLTAALAALGASEPVCLQQEDTFFYCPRGRLKLRRLSAASGELIHYQRPDDAGPKTSRYILTPTAEPDRLRDTLAAACGIVGVVRKQRTVRLVGRTRVHLDIVERLGSFIELEVVLDDDEGAGPGMAEARRLMTTLGIDDAQLVRGAYIDLLQAAPGAPR